MTTGRWLCTAMMAAAIGGSAVGCGEGKASSTSSSGGEGGEGSGSTSAGTGGATGSTSSGAGSSTSSTSSGAGGSAPALPACVHTCAQAADCTVAGVPAYDGDNWTCTDGLCVYTGCNTAKECTDTYKTPKYDCAPYPGESGKYCTPTCTKSSDCGNPNSPANDADNWACTGGLCFSIGCNSTKECIDSYQKPNYVCDMPPGGTHKTCIVTCTKPADCASPGTVLYEEDNWACTGGLCEYKGCTSSKECTDAYQKPGYVCK